MQTQEKKIFLYGPIKLNLGPTLTPLSFDALPP